jgi:recombination protein RecR
MYSRPIQKLLDAFARLPGVGPRTAERFVFHLLSSGKQEAAALAEALRDLVATVRSCERCFDFSDASPCALCRDPHRDAGVLCVIAEPADLQALERSGAYRGRYFVLRGTIDPTDEDALRRLKQQELFARLSASGGNGDGSKIMEVILAMNPDVAGETTMLFLERRARELRPDIKIARLARGLPMGSDLRYADEITLGSALKHRTRSV